MVQYLVVFIALVCVASAQIPPNYTRIIEDLGNVASILSNSTLLGAEQGFRDGIQQAFSSGGIRLPVQDPLTDPPIVPIVPTPIPSPTTQAPQGCFTTDGVPCVFPFLYKGDYFNGCTNYDHDKYWCNTNEDHFSPLHLYGDPDSDYHYFHYEWGNCNESCRHVPAPKSETPCEPIRHQCRGTHDTDGDGHPDSCDNCPHHHNIDQADRDDNRIGDACDNHQDSDKDGIPDGIDNCELIYNHDQSDVDCDSYGDACDEDDDGDSVLDEEDNCRLVPNPGQEDSDGDGIGDACQDDFDGDGILNDVDICKNDPLVHTVDFRRFHNVTLNREQGGQPEPIFVVSESGTKVTQLNNSRPGLMFGQHSMADLDFTGTLYVSDSDDDFVGFIFGYQDVNNFYVVMWKKGDQKNFECGREGRIQATAGIQLKRVHSTTGPSCKLEDALWSNSSRSDQTTVLWTDPNYKGWESNHYYHWELNWRPNFVDPYIGFFKGLIRFRFTDQDGAIVADSGNIYDDNIKRGFIGVYCQSQEDITWSNLAYQCSDDEVTGFLRG